MSEPSNSFVDLLKARAKDLPSEKYGYQLPSGDGFGMDLVISAEPEVNESEMSFVLPFADGNRRGLHRLPDPSVDDIVDGATCHFVTSGDRSLSFPFSVRLDDVWNVRRLQLGTAMTFPGDSGLADGRTLFWLMFNERSAVKYFEDCPFVYPEIFCDLPGGFTPSICCVNFWDLSVLDLGIADRFALQVGYYERAMSDAVLHVSGSGVPSKVGQTVVAGIAVPVTPLHTFWAFSDESDQYKLMHSAELPFVFLAQIDVLATVFSREYRSDFTRNSTLATVFVFNTAGDRFDSPHVADAVVSHETGDVTPTLDCTVCVTLNTLVEFPLEMIHCRFPLRFPCEEWAGGGKTALRVYSPSPCCFTDDLHNRQGRAA